MTQILVTLNEDATTLHVRKAIELLRGVASVKVFKGNAEKVVEKRRQEAYVKESLTRAFDEVKRARRGEHKMMTDEEFMAARLADQWIKRLPLRHTPSLSPSRKKGMFRYRDSGVSPNHIYFTTFFLFFIYTPCFGSAFRRRPWRSKSLSLGESFLFRVFTLSAGTASQS